MDTKEFNEASLAVEAWNKAYPIGQLVDIRYTKDGKPERTKTTTAAFLSTSSYASIMVEARRGHWALDRVKPVETPTPTLVQDSSPWVNNGGFELFLPAVYMARVTGKNWFYFAPGQDLRGISCESEDAAKALHERWKRIKTGG